MSIFPYINPEESENPGKEELPLFREYAYDFEKQCLKLRNGRHYLVEGNEALQIWIYFALATSRYHYVAHSQDYGSEIRDNIIGESNDELLQEELERYITEALMVNPYIEELSDFTFDASGHRLTASFVCTTVYGKMSAGHTVEGVI